MDKVLLILCFPRSASPFLFSTIINIETSLVQHAQFCWFSFFFFPSSFFRFLTSISASHLPLRPLKRVLIHSSALIRNKWCSPGVCSALGMKFLGRINHQSPLRAATSPPELLPGSLHTINYPLHQAGRKVGNPSKLCLSEDISKHPQENSEFWSKKFWCGEKIK